MILPLVIRPEAEQDLIDARDWYEQQRKGLGDEFVEQVVILFDKIVERPLMFAVVWEEVHSARLRRFPYLAYYLLHSDRVEVLAVLHGSRHPDTWRERRS